MRFACLAARGRPGRRRRVGSGGRARSAVGRDRLRPHGPRCAWEMRGTTAASRSRRVRQRCLSRSSGDRAVPYTVPMKAMQPQCCTSGAIPPSTFGCVPKDGYGSLSPFVPVRASPRAGHAVFPLRSRPGVLQPIVLARRPPRAPSAQRTALPGQLQRPTQACCANGLLASAPTLPASGQRRRRRQ